MTDKYADLREHFAAASASMKAAAAALTPPLPSQSTNPEAGPNETGRNAKLRAAANLAPTVIGGPIGEEVRHLLWTFYNTDSAQFVEQLAKAIIAAAPDRA